MYITSVVQFSPGDESAIVTVTDGRYTCWAFCWPCDAKGGERVAEPLALFEESNLMLSTEVDPRLERVNDTELRHRGVGRVSNVERGLVKVGGLVFEVGGWLPGGIGLDDMIEFECARIDLR